MVRNPVRIFACLAAIALLALAVTLTFATALRNHACTYDGFREWSEVAVIVTALVGALVAVGAAITTNKMFLIGAIVAPCLAILALAIASARHGSLEAACLARTVTAAIDACGVPSDRVALRPSRTQVDIVVRGNRDGLACLRDWADWHEAYRVTVSVEAASS